MDTKPNTRKCSRLQDTATYNQAKTASNKNQAYSDIPATNSTYPDTANPIGDNNFSKATLTNVYAPLVNKQNIPSPRSKKSPASRALSRSNKLICTMKIRLPDTNGIMKSMQSTLKEWFKVLK